MNKKEKQDLSEIDICGLFITPAIKDAGWDDKLTRQNMMLLRHLTKPTIIMYSSVPESGWFIRLLTIVGASSLSGF